MYLFDGRLQIMSQAEARSILKSGPPQNVWEYALQSDISQPVSYEETSSRPDDTIGTATSNGR